MIFVTVGTNEAPFDRLLRAVDHLPRNEPLVVQYGSSAVRPLDATCVDFLPFDELVNHVRAARAIITHAGVGSVMVALANGSRPIVLPRLRRFGEAVDDHQVPLARRLAGGGLVSLVEDVELLAEAVAGESNGTIPPVNGGSTLVDELRDYIRATINETS
jgi:beta-1,4-N-acetylglucosaminyltransferase